MIAFVGALFTRAVDPIIVPIAADLTVEPTTVALLSTAFALPFALVQPILGPLADMLGKARIMMACLAILVVTGFVSALAASFPVLLLARIVGGMASGGIFPVAIAIIGDMVPLGERQVAIGRYLAIVITGNLLGTVLAGLVGDLAGWRAVFFVVGAASAAAFAAAVIGFRGAPAPPPARGDFRSVPAIYPTILANPRAKV